MLIRSENIEVFIESFRYLSGKFRPDEVLRAEKSLETDRFHTVPDLEGRAVCVWISLPAEETGWFSHNLIGIAFAVGEIGTCEKRDWCNNKTSVSRPVEGLITMMVIIIIRIMIMGCDTLRDGKRPSRGIISNRAYDQVSSCGTAAVLVKLRWFFDVLLCVIFFFFY